jgi:hypothetical protein
MSWIYQGKEFDDKQIPDGAVGFVYIMSAIIDGKSFLYVGKKNFFANVKRPLGKKALAMSTDKRLKKYKRELKPDFMNYYSSNKILKDAHKAGVPIKREFLGYVILRWSLLIRRLNISLSMKYLRKKNS